ncbi:MAG: hypothetical protein JKY65_25735 [Planctomycetes bacterium]|nr:hypothetical protein [Planctomycetota bacterium]
MEALDAEFKELMEEYLADAHDDDEQLMGLHALLEDQLSFPAKGRVVGVEVEVVGVEYGGNPYRGVVAVCDRAGRPYAVSFLDVTFPPHSVAADCQAALRKWSGE